MTGERSASERVRARVVIHGIVQGVYFRSSAKRQADALLVDGWVRNRADGTVEAVLEGPPEAVERMLAWCRVGPPHAQVEDVEVAWEPPTGEDGFRITY